MQCCFRNFWECNLKLLPRLVSDCSLDRLVAVLDRKTRGLQKKDMHIQHKISLFKDDSIQLSKCKPFSMFVSKTV